MLVTINVVLSWLAVNKISVCLLIEQNILPPGSERWAYVASPACLYSIFGFLAVAGQKKLCRDEQSYDFCDCDIQSTKVSVIWFLILNFITER